MVFSTWLYQGIVACSFTVTILGKRHIVLSTWLYQGNIAWSFPRDYIKETSHGPFHVPISKKHCMVLSTWLYNGNVAWSFPRAYTKETSHCPFHVTIPIKRSHINSLIISSMSSTPLRTCLLWITKVWVVHFPFRFVVITYTISMFCFLFSSFSFWHMDLI